MTIPRPGIVLLTNEFRPVGGGIATYCHEMVLALHHAGAHVCVVAADKGPDPAAFDAAQPFALVRTREHAFPLRRHAERMLTLDRVVRRRKPAWLWASDWRTGLVVSLVAARRGIPFAVSAYGSELLEAGRAPWRAFLARCVFRAARTIFTISQYTTDLLTNLGVAGTRVTLIPPGSDPAGCRTTPEERHSLRARHGLANRPVVLTLARLAPRKGHDVVLNALPEVIRHIPHVAYVIAGKGDARSNLERIVEDLNLAENVIFTGFVSETEKSTYYAICDLYVLLSRREGDDVEGFGITLLEAAVCGKPVIAGDHGGARDAVVAGETGLLVDPRRPEKVAEAIVALLTNRERATAMGARARRRVERDANWTQAALRFLAALERSK